MRGGKERIMEKEGKEENNNRKDLEGEGIKKKKGWREGGKLTLLPCHQTPEWTAVNWTLITAEK